MLEVTTKQFNQILAALPDSEYQYLAPHLQSVYLHVGRILHDPGKTITKVYFPNDSMISLLSDMLDGSPTEIGLIGNKGIVGLPVIWGGNCSLRHAVVQIAGTAIDLPAEVLRREFHRGQTLQKLLLLYTQALFTQVSQTAACNRRHKIEKRLARWLLTVHDSVMKDEFLLTHSIIANMLGVRRSGVTVAAIALQEMGIIRYHRGYIKILDLEKLEQFSCECYSLVRKEFDRLLS